MADNILEVKKLRISFRTNNGLVKAVRDISFDLKRGETLAIVGESGSGKSVTNKAILGISAGNAIIDSGEILYDGKDLLKISEEDMCKIRGDKISMIFQDPLSSLDPIVKIGKQITEAMIIKNKLARKVARKEFNSMLETLKEMMIASIGNEKKTEIEELTKKFDAFCIKSNQLETSYNASSVAAQELVSLIEDFLFKAERKQKLEIKACVNAMYKKLNLITDEYFIGNDLDKVSQAKLDLMKVRDLKDVETKIENTDATYFKVPDKVIDVLKGIETLIRTLINNEEPNFFRIGYYALDHLYEDLTKQDVKELNEKCLQYLNENFMNKFLSYTELGLTYSYNNSINKKKIVLEKLPELKEYFLKADFTKKDALNKIKEIGKLVSDSIDPLETIKDSIAYTFEHSLLSNVKTYFANIVNNSKEQKRYDKQIKRYNALIEKGKKVDWKVAPAKIVDLNNQIENFITTIERLEEKYTNDVNDSINYDANKKAIDLVDFFKAKASEVVYKVTKLIAKEKAIKLMEEVGIPEPRIRFYQYPFEFSGGMRQRIVIAIALSANPDILICDEPTTALDVTIQSQILELINDLKKKRNLSVIFITHNLGVVANMADRIAVMYAGKIVEYGNSEEIFYSPAHPYTWALLSSMPDLDTKEKLEAIPGTPPNMIYPPKGDAFAARNKYALKIDFEEQPPLFKITDTHYAATWLLHPNAPKVEMPKIIRDRIERMKAKNEGGNTNE